MATYWGYDTFACPSSKELKGTFNSGCSFIGYYLAPTLNKHRTNTSFMGKRNAIINSGLNPVAIYMGSQPSDSGVNASLGTKEANDAATKASSTAPNVSLSGVSYATIWQCVQNENHSFSSDICLLVDLNSSTVKNPGA